MSKKKIKTKAKGSRFEREVVNFYRSIGIFAMRAPASLGIDVVVYYNKLLYGLECTTPSCIRSKKVQKLLKSCKEWGIVPVYCTKIKNTRGFRLTYFIKELGI